MRPLLIEIDSMAEQDFVPEFAHKPTRVIRIEILSIVYIKRLICMALSESGIAWHHTMSLGHIVLESIIFGYKLWWTYVASFRLKVHEPFLLTWLDLNPRI